jgi:hypothetical protein
MVLYMIWYMNMINDLIWYICQLYNIYNWVDSRWQWYSTHLHTNNTQNNKINNKTIRIRNKTTQTTNLVECWPCPVFVSLYPGICLTTKGKARKNFSQGSRRNSKYMWLRNYKFKSVILGDILLCSNHGQTPAVSCDVICPHTSQNPSESDVWSRQSIHKHVRSFRTTDSILNSKETRRIQMRTAST